MRYETVRAGVAGFLCAYLVLGMGAYFFGRAHEAYPFFSWALFQKVPQHNEERHTMRITSVDGRQLEAPLPLSEASEYLHFANLSEAESLVSHLVAAEGNSDREQLEATRRRLEQRMPRVDAYEVVRVLYDPIEYWRTGVIEGTEVVMSFQSGI